MAKAVRIAETAEMAGIASEAVTPAALAAQATG